MPAFAVPREMGEIRPAEDADIRPGEECEDGFRGAAVCADRRAYMVERRLQAPQVKQAASQDEVRRQNRSWSRVPLRHSQEFKAELPRFLQIAPNDMKDPG